MAFIGTSIELHSFKMSAGPKETLLHDIWRCLTLTSYRNFGLEHTSKSIEDTFAANIVSLLQADCFFGSLMSALVSDFFGRRFTLTLAGLAFCTGSVMQVASSGREAVMLVGRFFCGHSKCHNQRPICANCRTYSRDCVYTALPVKPRPSNRRLSKLEEENHQLRQRLQADGHNLDNEIRALATSPGQKLSRTGVNSPATLPAVEEPGQPETTHSTVSRIFISPNGESSYHGRTSTLFDDTATDQRVLQSLVADPKKPREWIKKGLMGEAAYQRKLDFDGEESDLGMHLLSLHWNRQYFLNTYRPAFMRDMACGGPYFSKLLLNAIYFAASKFSPCLEVRQNPEDVRTAGWRYRRRVKELLGSALDRSDITTVQALLVMTSSLMIIDLGMHIDAPFSINMRRLSEEDLEIRRRVFWGAFVVDKVQSLYQGRPPSFQVFDTNVPLTFLDRYEELEHWTPFAYPGNPGLRYPGSPAYSVSTFTEICKLSVILNAILNKVYSEESPKRVSEEMVSSLTMLDFDLQRWHEGLPSHLKFDGPQDTPPPHVLFLLALYNVLMILLHRPFVAEGHLHNTVPSTAINSFCTCTTAAKAIIKLLQDYNETFSTCRAPYLISYATYLRIAVQREWDSQVHASLRTCLSAFDENQDTNWAVRRAKNVVIHLMERMGVSLDRTHRTLERDNSRSSSAENESLDSLHPMPTPVTLLPSTEQTDPIDLSPVSQADPETAELDMDMIIQSFITQGNYDLTFDTWSPPVASAGESRSVELGIPMGVPSDRRRHCGDVSFHDMLFGFNGSGQDMS
ncbi:hypothetical protein BDV23DRAFT_188320 [Aspergillus alliaceus]|uniref:Xylanolytic transcriptional activator regulatory domain-containing protein n=1 Tax=Petromyces alliaceus TaxID=209559 RepID=A0A5N7BU50_PETAA|nr:hypothetical protein BDV23DRAFT_188320 [Aspergillus alliaceus]